MAHRFSLLVLLVIVLAGSSVRPAGAYIADDRWTTTATNGSTGTSAGPPPTSGVPVTLTWSFAPDGTVIPGNSTGETLPSGLIGFLDLNFGAGPGGDDYTQRPWFHIFEESFDRLTALSGVTYVYEPNDDGHVFSSNNNARGVLGARGDVRLGGKTYGPGSSTLAANFFPNYGEMMINTDQASFFTASGNNYRRFRNTIMHESMHGLGISHVESSSSGFLIEPFLSTSFDGPQLDDLLAIQRLYGDVKEKAGGNDTATKATPLGAIAAGGAQSIGTLLTGTTILSTQTSFVSIDDDSDFDYFSFTLADSLDVRLTLTPAGATYMVGPQGGPEAALNSLALNNLALSLVGPNGTTTLSAANSHGAGLAESIIEELAPGTYYARVTGSANNIQLYRLAITGSTTGPATLIWSGSVNTTWDVGLTANFDNAGAADEFQNGDFVTFDAAPSATTVNLPADVAPGSVTVQSSGSYVFTGPGGIISGSLTIAGGAILELANSGNSYSGPTLIQAGSLRLSGHTSAMVTPITVSGGSSLVVDTEAPSSVASPLTFHAGSTLAVGAFREATVTGNTTISDATVQLEEGATAAFSGEWNAPPAASAVLTLNIAAGALAHFTSPVALGAGGIVKQGAGRAEFTGGLQASGLSDVQQGTLGLDGGEPLAGEFRVHEGAAIEVALAQQFDAAARLSGDGEVIGALHFPGTLAPGNAIGALTMTGDLSLDSAAVLKIELGGLTPGLEYDRLHVSGAAKLRGELEVSLANGFVPAAGESFSLVTATELMDQFETLTLPTVEGLMWDVSYLPTEVLLTVAAAPVQIAADFDENGVVDAADLAAWQTGFGIDGTAIHIDGDADGDQVVDGADFLLWQRQLTAPVEPPMEATAVPEPQAALLCVMAIACAAPFRGRALACPNAK